jgi:hypothetical protein
LVGWGGVRGGWGVDGDGERAGKQQPFNIFLQCLYPAHRHLFIHIINTHTHTHTHTHTQCLDSMASAVGAGEDPTGDTTAVTLSHCNTCVTP